MGNRAWQFFAGRWQMHGENCWRVIDQRGVYLRIIDRITDFRPTFGRRQNCRNDLAGIALADAPMDRTNTDNTLTNPDLAPVTPAQRTWRWYHFAALWLGMVIAVPAYMIPATIPKRLGL